MARRIPWQNSYDFQFEISLDDFVYLIRVRWNKKAEVFGMDLLTRNRRPLALGIAIVPGVNLFRGITDAEAPKGAMFLVGAKDPESLNAGTSALVYLTEAEVNAV